MSKEDVPLMIPAGTPIPLQRTAQFTMKADPGLRLEIWEAEESIKVEKPDKVKVEKKEKEKGDAEETEDEVNEDDDEEEETRTKVFSNSSLLTKLSPKMDASKENWTLVVQIHIEADGTLYATAGDPEDPEKVRSKVATSNP